MLLATASSSAAAATAAAGAVPGRRGLLLLPLLLLALLPAHMPLDMMLVPGRLKPAAANALGCSAGVLRRACATRKPMCNPPACCCCCCQVLVVAPCMTKYRRQELGLQVVLQLHDTGCLTSTRTLKTPFRRAKVASPVFADACQAAPSSAPPHMCWPPSA
jgi:hypothetical protein